MSWPQRPGLPIHPTSGSRPPPAARHAFRADGRPCRRWPGRDWRPRAARRGCRTSAGYVAAPHAGPGRSRGRRSCGAPRAQPRDLRPAGRRPLAVIDRCRIAAAVAGRTHARGNRRLSRLRGLPRASRAPVSAPRAPSAANWGGSAESTVRNRALLAHALASRAPRRRRTSGGACQSTDAHPQRETPRRARCS